MTISEAEKITKILKNPSLKEDITDYERNQRKTNAEDFSWSKKYAFFVFCPQKLSRPLLICKKESSRNILNRLRRYSQDYNKAELIVYDVLNPEFKDVEYQDIGVLRMYEKPETQVMKIDLIDMEYNRFNETDYKFMGIGSTLFNMGQHIAAANNINTLEIMVGPIGSLPTETIKSIYFSWGFEPNGRSHLDMDKELDPENIRLLKNTPLDSLGILSLEKLTPRALHELSTKTNSDSLFKQQQSTFDYAQNVPSQI